MFKGFIVGIVVTLVVSLTIVYVGLTQGYFIPPNADAKPARLEVWAARRAQHAVYAREAPTSPNPVALTDANLMAGAKIYGENCSTCHGVADGKPSVIAVGLYQKPPQMENDGVEDDPEGITYWKVKHGLRLTGMPAFTATLSEEQIWQVTLFLKHMDHLTPGAKRLWEAMKNPVRLAPESAASVGLARKM